jgi:methyl-accepting chemotaxis protein
MIFEIFLGTLLVIEGYIIWNLNRKTEMLENWVEDYTETIQRVNDTIKQIDYKGYFEEDDEVGTIFEQIKNSVDELNKFTEEIESKEEK